MKLYSKGLIHRCIFASLLFISITSLVGVVLLAVKLYSPVYSLIVGVIVTFITIRYLKGPTSSVLKNYPIKVDREGRIVLMLLVLVILLATIIRIPSWYYTEGGQDQGIYTTISKVYDRTGSVYEVDPLRKKVVDLNDEEAIKVYDSENHRVIAAQRYDLLESKFYFPFYPVHPIWMSISASLFGDSARSLSITFFSIISIVGIYLLSSSLFNNRWVGLFSSVLIAFLPLHVYFSKLPVTEIPSIAIVTFAFYYLLRFFKDNLGSIKGRGRKNEEIKNGSYLIVSSLLFTTFYFTRVSGILYLPFFGMLALITIEFLSGRFRLYILYYLLSIYLGFLLSLTYYYNVIPYLFRHFFLDYFSENQIVYVIPFLFVVPFIVYLYTIYLNGTFRKTLLYIKENYIYLSRIVVIIVMLGSLYQLYKVGFTNLYSGSVYDLTWNMVNGGLKSIKDLSITSIVAHLSPFISIPLFIYLFIKKKYSVIEILLYSFFYIFLIFSIFVTKFIPHHYYFARYQLIEVIPFAIIIFSSLLVKLFNDRMLWKRVLFYTFTGLFTVYSGIYISVLGMGSVGHDSEFYSVVNEEVSSRNDMLIIYEPSAFPENFLVTPLRHYYLHNVYQISDISKIYVDEVSKLFPLYDGVFLLTTSPQFNLDLIKEVNYTHTFYQSSSESPDFNIDFDVEGFDIPFCKEVFPSLEKYCGGIIPSKYHSGVLPMYLYRLK